MAKRCPACESIYGDSIERCPQDNSALEPFDSDQDPLIGAVIDERFRLEDLLGAGGMGRVYRGVQLSIDRDVAVKLLRGEAIPNHSMHERFIREARVISGFSHPNIIRLIDFGRDEERESPYLVMELAGGVSLADLVGSGRLEVSLAVEIARQVCSGLLEAHGEDIVHRDLKPDNLHLIANSDGSFHVKILDFGIAFPQNSSKNLTATGMMCGTAPYVSPEQARSEDLDGQADLYSLGIILFEMLTGIRPFQGESGFEIIMQQVNEPPPELRQYVPPDSVPDELVELVYDLLEKDARERPSGARAVRDRLDAVADRLDSTVTLDLGRSGIDMYEPWLLPALPEDAPIHESDTRAAEAPGGGEQEAAAPENGTVAGSPGPSDGKRELRPRSGFTDAVETGDRPEEGETADAAGGPGAAQRAEADASGPTAEARVQSGSSGWRGPLAVAAAIAGLAVAVSLGLAAIVSWGGDETSEASEASADRSASAGGADANSQDAGELEPISGPLNEFAGRCVVVGSSDAEFDTVYFYPEIGELLLRGDSTLDGSKLELAGRRDGRIHFRYAREPTEESPDGTDAARTGGHVRKSADKRFFEFDDAGEFVCRREPYGAYYTGLELDGSWEAAESDHRLEVPSAGQRFTVVAPEPESDAGTGKRSFEYRLLDGAPDDSEVLLAVRSPGSIDEWERWRMRRGSEGETLTLVRRPGSDDALTRQYERPDSGSDSGARAAASSASSSGDDTPSGAGSSSGSNPSAGSGRSRGSAAPPLARRRARPSEEALEAWETRFEKIRDKCRSAAQTIEHNNERYQELIDEDKMDRAREFAETMKKENKKAGQRMQESGREFSALVTEMTRGGVGAARIQEMSREYSEACQID